MKYFIDTEFIEGFHKPLFGKKRHFIDLISIGIVCEDGREYYAISNEFNPKDADKWVKDNVISKLTPRYLKGVNKWKSNKQIAQEIRDFFGYRWEPTDYADVEITSDNNIEIYAYYADYDWVAFCSLFGRMIDLPDGMPMYCRDLKQTLDEKVAPLTSMQLTDIVYGKGVMDHDVYAYLASKGAVYSKIECLKDSKSYPLQKDEHNALDDAKWNKRLYEFMLTF